MYVLQLYDFCARLRLLPTRRTNINLSRKPREKYGSPKAEIENVLKETEMIQDIRLELGGLFRN
jgi:hypothetical protein